MYLILCSNHFEASLNCFVEKNNKKKNILGTPTHNSALNANSRIIEL